MADDLMPGLYVVADERFRVWRHWRRRVPDHLRDTRLHDEDRSPWRFRETTRIARLIAHYLLAGRLAWFRTGSTGRFSIVIAASEESIILLSPEAGVVRRVSERPIFTDEYRRLRASFSAHLDGPQFEIDADEHGVTEDFVGGTTFQTLSPQARIVAAREILAGFAALTARHAEGDASSLMKRVGVDLRSLDVPASFEFDVRYPRIVTRAGQWPLTPSHGDLHPSNLVRADDRLVVIDFAGIRSPGGLAVGLRPFWYDAYTLLASPAVPDLLRLFLRGGFDEELTRLHESAGLEYRPAEVADMLRAWVLIRAHGEAVEDGAAFATRLPGALRFHWSRIEAALRALPAG